MLYLNHALTYYSDYAPDKVMEAYASIDYNEIFVRCLATLSVEEWDKKSPINGVSAEKVLARRDDIQGKVYLIKGPDGRVQYLQPYMPGVEGHQPIDDVLTAGWKHAKQIAESKADQLALISIQRKLLGLA